MAASAQVLPSRLLILLLALSATFLLFSSRVEAEQPAELAEWVVAPGETLWDIAEGLTEPGEDVRVTVAALREVNGLADASLRAGQRLLVPAGAPGT